MSEGKGCQRFKILYDYQPQPEGLHALKLCCSEVGDRLPVRAIEDTRGTLLAARLAG